MATFALAADLASYLQATFTTAQTATATLLLTLASDEIRSVTGQEVDRVTDDAVELDAPADRELVLPQRPADEPTLVKVDGIAVTDWTFRRDTLYRPAGWVARDTNGVTLPVEVTYTHGWTTLPAELKRVTLQAAARAMRNPDGLREWQTGSESETFATETVALEVNLTDAEAKAVRRALGVPRRRTIWLSPT